MILGRPVAQRNALSFGQMVDVTYSRRGREFGQVLADLLWAFGLLAGI
jgi:hypothetical protein